MSAIECQEVFARLSEYIDGELPDDLGASLARHIEDCAPCIEFVESLCKAKELCRGFEGTAQPDKLDPAVREQMRLALSRCLNEA